MSRIHIFSTGIILMFGIGFVGCESTTEPDPLLSQLHVSVDGTGSVTKHPNAETFNEGDTVRVTAIAEAGWTFHSWGGSLTGSANPSTITMDSDKAITAFFIHNQFSVQVTTNGHGTVHRTPGGPFYSDGSTVQLTATPASGWTFSHWSGDVTSENNPVQMTVTDHMQVTAVFTAEATSQQEYTLSLSHSGQGVYGKSPDLVSYPEGSYVVITANPMVGWTFYGWGLDAMGTTNPLVVHMTDNKNIQAVFVPAQYRLNTTRVGGDEYSALGVSPGKAEYSHGEEVTLTAIPGPNYDFRYWIVGGVTYTESPLTLTMTSAVNVFYVLDPKN